MRTTKRLLITLCLVLALLGLLSVSAFAASVSYLEVQTPVFVAGEEWSADGFVVTAVYDNNDADLLEPTDYTVTPCDLSTGGVKTVTVTYGSVSAQVEVAVHAEGSVQTVDPSLYPESQHPYQNSANEEEMFTVPGASRITLTFSTETQLENSYDNLYVYDGSDRLVAQYTGTQARGVTLTVYGDTVKFQMITDGSVTYHGYSFSQISAMVPAHTVNETVQGQPASCTEGGWSDYGICSFCAMHVGRIVYPALGHTYEAVVTPATPTANGYTTHSCVRCEDSYITHETIYGAAESGMIGATISWNLMPDGKMIISGTGAMDDMGGYIGTDPFLQQIKQVEIREGITYIGDYVFSGCTNLTSVSIASTVEAIGDYAFEDCTALTAITIPASVEYIGNDVFYGCLNMTKFVVDAANESYANDRFGVLYSKDMLEVIQAPAKLSGSYVIPNTVEYIGYAAFADCLNLKSVTIPDSVYAVGSYTFADCKNLTSVTLPEGLEILGEGMFYGCEALTSVTLPESLATIHYEAFCGCSSLTDIVLPELLTNINDYAFQDCIALKSIVIPDGVYYVGDSAFAGCTALESVTLSAELENIGSYAFEDCSALKSIAIPECVSYIGYEVFFNCSSLTRIDVDPDNAYYTSDDYGVLLNQDGTYLLQIPGGFSGSYTVPDTVEVICEYSIANCKNLTALVIPASVTNIDSYALYGCDKLTSITVSEDNETYSNDAFGALLSKDQTYLIYVPGGRTGNYTIADTITNISYSAFYQNASLTSVTIPAALEYLEFDVFDDMPNLQKFIVAEDHPSYLSDSKGVVYCKDGCCLYRAPDGLSGIYEIMPGTECIENDAFEDCANLTMVTIPDGVTEIYGDAFRNCSSLVTVSIPDSVDYIGSDVFRKCTSLRYIALPAGIEYINDDMFRDCTSLEAVYIPGGIYEIGGDAFEDCENLMRVYFGGSQEKWENVYISSNDNEAIYRAELYLDWDYAYPAISDFESTPNGIRLSWNPVAGAAKYRVFAKTSKGWLKLGDTWNTSFLYTDAKAGLTYTFTVRALNAAGTAFTSAYNTTGWKHTFMPKPVISKFENAANGIKITWNPINGAAKYRVFAKTSKGWLKLADVTGTSYIYTGAKSGLTYTFTVRALNAAGTAFTSAYNATGWRWTYVAQPAISGFQNAANGIQISWGKVSGAAKYRVFVRTSKGWVKLADTTANTYLYTAAKPGLTYTFTIRALNAAGTAYTSSYNTVGWKQTYVAQPVIKAFQNTANGIKISWNAVAGAGKYRVFAKTSKGWMALGDTTATSFVYTGAKSGLTYTFTVRAMNAAGTAYTSSYNTTGWRYTFIAQPAITKLTSVSNGIKLNWGAVPGAAQYQVFAKTSKGWVAVGKTTGTTFTWTGAQKGYTYTFTLRCMNAAGTAYTSSFNTTGWSIKCT